MEWATYYLGIARAVSVRASCSRRRVGAIIVVNRSIVSTGYNGTPFGVTNCNEGGCLRCAGDAPPGSGYDTCVCVHAEQNAIAQAARRGNSTDTGTLYCTLRPCFSCAKEAVQAGIHDFVFEELYEYPRPEVEEAYRKLIKESGIRLQWGLTCYNGG